MDRKERVKKPAEEDLDRGLIGELVKTRISRFADVGTVRGLERESGVSRSTINRIVLDHDDRVSEQTYLRLEAPLRLPPGTLMAVGRRNLAQAQAVGAPGEVLSWLSQRTAGQPGSAVGGAR